MCVPICSKVAPRNVHRSPAIACALEQRTAQNIACSLSETTQNQNLFQKFYKHSIS